jgi:symplekin
MEPPKIPVKGIDLLKVLCGQAFHAENGMALLMDLAMKRPKKLHYLSTILEFCAHTNDEVRSQAVTCVLKLYESMDNMKGMVEDHAVHTYMNALRLPNPPELLFTETLGRMEVKKDWTDELVKSCLTLYLQLLTLKNSLIHE